MSAGLPGLGLGGLFFIISALLAPLFELRRTLQGHSSRAAWRAVGRQFAQAAAMVLTVDLALRGLYLFLGVTGLAEAPAADSATALPLVAIGITSGLLVAVVVLAKAADLALRARSAGLPSLPAVLPRPSPWRALSTGGTAAVAFFALLAFGAAELSPVPERDVRSAPAPQTLAVGPSDAEEGSGVSDRAASAPLGAPEADAAAPGARAQGPPGAHSVPAALLGDVGPGASGETPSQGGQPETGPGGAVTPGTDPAPPSGGTGSAPPGAPPADPPAPEGGATNGNGGGQGPPTHAGPSETAGPSEGSNAPEHAGPKENAGPKPRN